MVKFHCCYTILKFLCNNVVWRYFCKEVEHISPELPYRLDLENHAQNTRDNLGDISFKPDRISPCISPEENDVNRTQNGQLRRSGDVGDICSQRIIVITIIITQFLIPWHMITNVFFLQFFTFSCWSETITTIPPILSIIF